MRVYWYSCKEMRCDACRKPLHMYCMATETTKKRAPHARLKLLRKMIGVSQPELAKMIGVSQPYILSIEIGQRELSQRVAEAVFVATLISPDWLLGKIGEDGKPLDTEDKPYTDETYRLAKHPLTLVGPLHEKFLDQSSNYMRGVHVLLRAAARKGKYRMAEYYVNNCIKDAREDLGLDAMMKSEGEAVAPPPLPPVQDAETAAIGNKAFKQTLSWRAVADWKEACAGTPEDRQKFLQSIDEVRAMVQLAFDYADGKIPKGANVGFMPPSGQPSPTPPPPAGSPKTAKRRLASPARGSGRKAS